MSRPAPDVQPAVRISGGVSIGVDTAVLGPAAQQLAAASDALSRVAFRASTVQLLTSSAPRRAHLDDALLLMRRAEAQAEAAADGLRIAADRYGMTERAVLDGQRAAAAAAASVAVPTALLAPVLLGPIGSISLAADVAMVVGYGVLARMVQQYVETGRFAPQSDPVLIRAIALTLASLDDVARGALLQERPEDLVADDPAGRFGSESVAALLAAVFLTPAGGPLTVTSTTRRPTISPQSLTALADRLPDGKQPTGQVRIERYDGAEGRRWIVYIAGTVTFAPDSGAEPFDLASNLLGVAHEQSDSERAVLQAMKDAGIGPEEPVLLVGHSQGALNAVRVAQDGGYQVGGVVELGGPTGQITLPADVPVLAVEHDEDLVPALGGVAAGGAAGLNRLVVTRSLPNGGAGAVTSAATKHFPAHDLGAYRQTLAMAEASDDARVALFREQLSPFLTAGPGTATRYHAARVLPAAAPADSNTPSGRPRN